MRCERGAQEYVVLMAMRNVDVKQAQVRSLSFARRLWENQVVKRLYKPLCRPTIIIRLMRW